MQSQESTATAEAFASPGAVRLRFKLVLPLAAIAALIVFWHVKTETATVRWDFQQFYLVAQMITHGQAVNIYDFAAQAAFQAQYVDPSRAVQAPDVPFLYPAATALPFLPLTWLPLAAAYAVWTVVNLLLLLAAVRLLQRELKLGNGDWPLFAALIFTPVIVCLLHGQVSILVLFCYTLGFVLMRQNRLFLAGVAVGLAAIKFQLMVGFVAILLLRRCWKFAGGAATGALAIATVSGLIVGWRQLLAYPAFLRASAYHGHVSMPMLMVNLRGFLWLLLGREPQVWLAAGLSAIFMVCAAVAWRDDDPECGFSLALIAAILTAYHAYPQELTLLLVPLAVAVSREQRSQRRALALLLTVWLSMLGLFMLGGQGLMGVVAALLLVTFFFRDRTTTALQGQAASA